MYYFSLDDIDLISNGEGFHLFCNKARLFAQESFGRIAVTRVLLFVESFTKNDVGPI